MSEFCQELLFHLFNLPATLAWCSAHQGRPFLNLEEVILENQPAILLIASAWTDQSLLSRGPGLLSCYLFCSFLIPSWIPSSHGHCSHYCSSLHIPDHFVLIFKCERPNRASSHIVSLITHVRRPLSGCSRDLLDCLYLPFSHKSVAYKASCDYSSSNGCSFGAFGFLVVLP